MNEISNFLGISKRTVKYIVLMFILLVFLTTSIFTVEWFVQFSALPIGITKAFIGIMALSIIDDVVFGDIDTFREITKGNIAYALLYLANAIIIAAGIMFI